ncbi:uncharacterized protein BO95DRAFT_469189 [Aspergillus brunneoviolaceus CBS 621.78]|uniref:Uncharacterized protein n=1 Tax=Aspergillus brunneoviolaceus CBS 621.78 TaxID=1450534 RepID=A0ACD1FSS0_9EURO|nr:hypothetical protein BO95DRAFT_469189 [Aspergillus brunneoviolaceus CBS 621.78]RAH39991.1 hypothetical protein BO95DRAFT_469189 [Aspergillus brunneoviolaceus CBS 621.78]
MTKSILGKRSVPSLLSMTPNQSVWLTLSQSVARTYSAGSEIDWDAIHREHETRLKFLPLPPYSFDLKSYWLQYRGDCLITKRSPTHGLKSAWRSFEPTPTIQRIEKEELVAGGGTISFVSDLNDPILRAVVTGHLVRQVALCPSSVYADMALTAATYMWSRSEPHSVPAMEIQDMAVRQPLILEGRDELLAYITISKAAKSHSATVAISTRRYAGDDIGHEAIHAQCVVIFGDGNDLKAAAQKGEIHKLKRSMIYRLFSSFVKYSKPFQGMDEVWMDSDLFEAAAQIRFASIATNSKFTFSPIWLDSLIHLSGFILNVSEAIPEDTVYISHGWKSMRFATSISATGHYQAYVHMQESQASGNKDVMSGDVYILEQDGNRVIGLVTDVRFKAVKRRLLDVLLPSTRAALAIAKPEQKKSRTLEAADRPRTDETPFARLRACISDETGVPVNELTEKTNLAEIGLDSLLSFAVVAGLQQELQVEISRSALISSKTLGDLRPDLQATKSGDDGDEQVDQSSSEEGTGILTPTTSIAKEPTDLFQAFKSVIFVESEVDPRDVVISGTDFADLGIDSLLGLAILNAFQYQSGCRLPHSFFSDYPTFADAERYFHSRSSTSLPRFPLPVGISQDKVQSPAAVCQSVQLQGDSAYNGPALFLLPDGSSSAGPYAGIPALGSGRYSGLRVWGLNSPFVRCTQPFDVSLTSMAKVYVTEIVRLDPNGPYLLGGWSVGGILAFEAARLLRELNRVVQGLFLIDAPCPGTIPPLSHDTIQLLDRLGVITSKELQPQPRPQLQQQWRQPGREESIRAHFIGTIQALKTYIPLIEQRG